MSCGLDVLITLGNKNNKFSIFMILDGRNQWFRVREEREFREWDERETAREREEAERTRREDEARAKRQAERVAEERRRTAERTRREGEARDEQLKHEAERIAEERERSREKQSGGRSEGRITKTRDSTETRGRAGHTKSERTWETSALRMAREMDSAGSRDGSISC
jgi:hypothetical protein